MFRLDWIKKYVENGCHGMRRNEEHVVRKVFRKNPLIILLLLVPQFCYESLLDNKY